MADETSSTESGYLSFRIAAPAAFEDVVTHFYIARNNTKQALTKTLLPSYQTILVFSFGSAVSLLTQQQTHISMEKCLVLGPIKQAFNYTLPAGAEILVVNFKADAFYRFFGPVVLRNHLATDPNDLLPENCFTDLWHDLKKLQTPEQRVDRILSFSLPYLKNRDAVSERLATINDAFLNPIKTVAREQEQSERAVQLKQKNTLVTAQKNLTGTSGF